ncbi:hypothetical protein LCGC14_1260930 [marine sediment metagenome]|uniref:Uncharacterized protein n=1 Tax=marine sediment metagenome TaxID=412755 RepID=A0A0F9NHD7_9ZZZZ
MMINRMAGLISIPRSGTKWSAYVRPIGVVVFAEWKHEDEVREKEA